MKPLFTLELHPDEWLRVMRSRLELTQGELAERLGVERRSVMRYELGICKIPQARLEAIRRMAEETLS
ncbi:MAG TPA: helix-turn-helix transcriptional regulator [Candidatus Cybelea sp.]|nr:helix-turn-helix transcriptional regulator [Candidatus Cybelea sp.]